MENAALPTEKERNFNISLDFIADFSTFPDFSQLSHPHTNQITLKGIFFHYLHSYPPLSRPFHQQLRPGCVKEYKKSSLLHLHQRIEAKINICRCVKTGFVLEKISTVKFLN